MRTDGASSIPEPSGLLAVRPVDPSPFSLRVIAPRRLIFISRSASDTTEANVLKYVNAKLNVPNIEIFKFKFNSSRVTASFKLMVPECYFQPILDENFWPQHTVVHEYVARSRDRRTVVPPPVVLNQLNTASKH